MDSRRKLFLIPALALATALAWTALGTFSSASGQEQTGFIGRAHEGERAPTFTEPVFILVLGGDSRRANPLNQRMDSIHIVSIVPPTAEDPEAGARASILGIPRDTYVAIPGQGNNKINAAGPVGGPALMVETVEKLTGCEFDYYMLTAFDGFGGRSKHPNSPRRTVAPGVIDDIGGVDFVVPKGGLNDKNAGANFPAGKQHFDGSDALAWSRSRYDRPRGDFDRQFAQGELMVAVLDEMRRDYAANPATALRNLAAARKHIKMNIPLTEALKLGLFAMKVKPSAVENQVMDGTTGTAGGASIVRPLPGARAQFVDICGDGILES